MIGITQRVDLISATNERRDSLDQRWTPFLEACGLDAVPIPNCLPDPVKFAEQLGIGGLLFSGGNSLAQLEEQDSAPERDHTETLLVHHGIAKGLPLLGVCRGMQFLNVFHGGKLSKISGHVATHHPLAATESAPPGLVVPEVNSYHQYGIALSDLSPSCSPWALADGTVEMMKHRALPHFAMMWHPERDPKLTQASLRFFRGVFLGEPWQ